MSAYKLGYGFGRFAWWMSLPVAIPKFAKAIWIELCFWGNAIWIDLVSLQAYLSEQWNSFISFLF